VEEQTPRPDAERRAPSEGDTSKRGIISPLVRRLADEHDVDLDEVSGTGTGGRIRKQDVLRFVEERRARPAARPAASAEPAPEPAPEKRPAAAPVGGREELVPWTNIRRRTAEHMVASHLETARAWNAVEVDWTDIVALRTRAKGAFREREGFGLTYMPFLSKAVCETLLEMPIVNSTYDQDQQGNRVKYFVNLGIAVALEGGGLIVPVVKAADEKNLVGLARGINDVATRARSKKLSPDDLSGGTFTITNPGPFGSIISVPIIPQGQTAILGFEAIQKRVVATDDDSIAVRSMGFLSMSWDHRAIDGAEAARFLAALRERIEATDFSPELAAYL
jgi:pyruvate/2-oxoglutarate dehydrogenase complex dihydrolipoamide acyltransferase (E2) component